MIKPTARVLVAASALVLAIGPVADSASASSSTPVYHQSDSGSTVSTTVGAKFKVRLKACEDCGDHWSFAQKPDPNVIKLIHKTDVSSATPPAVGGINTVTWTYKAVGSGSTTLKLAEHDAKHHNKVIKRFSLTVNVAPTSQLPSSG